MDLTSPTHGRIYARPSRTFTIPEPGVQPQHPVTAPQISSSVPPNLHTANRRLQPLLSPSLISPPLSLPNIHSATPDNHLHHQSLAPPHTYYRLNNSHLHQPVLHNSPGLSYTTHHSILPPIAAPVPRAPIPNLDQSIHSRIRSLSAAPSPHDFYPPQYAQAVVPDAVNAPLRTPSQAHSQPRARAPVHTPSSVTESHRSLLIPPYHHTPPLINDYAPQPIDIQHVQNNFAPPPFHLPNNYFAPPPFAPQPFAPQPFPAQNNFFPPPFPPAPFQVPYDFAPPHAQAPRPSHRRPPTLPSTKDVPKLTGKSDWGAWNTAVTTLIANQLVFGHISDDLDPGARFDPDLVPSLPPVIHPNSPPADLDEYSHWWSMDGIASHILCSTVDAAILNSLPMPNTRLGERRTARNVYAFLRQHYGSGDYNSVANIEFKLRTLSCGNGAGYVSVQDYISLYRLYTNEMSSAGYPMPPRQLLQLFADGLPNNAIFSNLRQSTYISLDETDDLRLPTMEQTYARARIIDDTSQRLRLRRTDTKTRPSNPPPTTTTSTEQKAKPVCGNCGGVHLTKNCFQAGGAMEGKRDEVLASRAPRPPQAHVAVADVGDTGPGPDADSDDFEITDLTSAKLAALSITRPISAESIAYSSYAMSTIPEPVTSSSTLITPAYLVSSKIAQNSVLDSACTQHIIRDRNLFWSYDPAGARSVGTANCGTLETLAAGDVKLRLTIDDGLSAPIHVNWTLRNCLHAPDCPINLISVGMLNDARMTVNFAPDSVTTLTFPDDPEKLGRLAGKSFPAKVINKLSFLDCNFAYPAADPDIEPIYALPVFPPTVLNPELWHRRLGHPGMDTTRDVLTKDTVTGITWTGSFTPDHCIPCLIGKSPQASYSSNKHRATDICELVHIDTCGPYPVLTRKKERYFLAILDDHSNYGACPLLVLKSGACIAWRKTKARWENLSGNKVKAIRVDNAKEFVEGKMREDLDDAGIAVQATAPYAHQQNGKIERYIRTISDTAQALLADSKLPASFWGLAVSAAVYLRNRIPTKTLPGHITPHEKMTKEKPDLSMLRIFGCQCFVHQPEEIRGKGAARRFEAIFVGYAENRLGWLVCDLNGKFFFSRDVVFNESVPGHLSPPRSRPIPSPTDMPLPPKPDRVLRSQSRPLSLIAEVISDRDERLSAQSTIIHPQQTFESISAFIAINELNSLLSPAPMPTSPSLEHSFLSTPRYPFRFRIQDYDPDKAPDSYNEAIARPDKDVWMAAMQREKDSLEHRGAFERVTPIPKDRKAIGVRWTFVHKYNPDGSIKRGKEKARLVAQGFSQREGIDFAETYAPVVKMTSTRIILAYANFHDCEIMSFDVKTAFLHAKLDYLLYVKQIPGFPEADPHTVLRLLVALYGLRQSAYEFYKFLLRLLLRLGLSRSELDHSVFIGRWTSPPHSSIPMPLSGKPLILIVPIHVDDGLAVSNSTPLYLWFIDQLTPDLEIVDMGPVSMYLGERITRDRANRKLWISQKPLIVDLLHTWNMLDCTPSNVPLSQPLHKLPTAPPNSIPDVRDDEILINYQRLVGSLTYIAICTRPDIAYVAMALGQFNANPTRAHLLAAKGVLRYLAGTLDYGLEYAVPTPSIPLTVVPFIQGCALTDADWASDENDRKSVSGYCFYLHGCLISWSAQKQKVIASSSTEAEYYSLSYALREGLWIRLFLTSLQLPIPTPFPLLCDNQSAIKLANSDTSSSRSKHIDVRYHFICKKIEDGTFVTTWIPTGDMTADIFTKPLPFPSFSKHRRALGIVPVP
jgi:transposase InsO family protein